MIYKITDFFRAHKSTIRVILGFALLIASFLLIIYRHPFAGAALFLVGLTLLAISIGKLLGPSDYAGSGTLNGINGMGRQQSSINKKPTSTVANETTSAIWDQMKAEDKSECNGKSSDQR